MFPSLKLLQLALTFSIVWGKQAWGGYGYRYSIGTHIQPTLVDESDPVLDVLAATYHHEQLYGVGILYMPNVLLTIMEKHHEDHTAFGVVMVKHNEHIIEFLEEEESVQKRLIGVNSMKTFDETSRTYTLAVFKLNVTVADQNQSKLVRLVESKRDYAGSIMRLVGWTYPSHHNYYNPTHPTLIDAIALSNPKCAHRTLFWVDRRLEMCVGDLDNNRSLYPFLQGSPLLLPYPRPDNERPQLNLVGLFSWSEETPQKDHPSVFLKLAPYAQWIHSNI